MAVVSVGRRIENLCEELTQISGKFARPIPKQSIDVPVDTCLGLGEYRVNFFEIFLGFISSSKQREVCIAAQRQEFLVRVREYFERILDLLLLHNPHEVDQYVDLPVPVVFHADYVE